MFNCCIKCFAKKCKKLLAIEILFWLCLVVFGIIFTYVGLALWGNGLQKYTDVVYEYTAFFNSNKSAEIYLTYFLAIIGAGAIFVFYGLRNAALNDSYSENVIPLDDKRINIISVAILTSTVVYYVIWNGTHPFLLTLLILLTIFCIIDKSYAIDGLVFFITSIYAITAIFRLYVYFGGDKRIDIMTVMILSSLITLLVFALEKRNKSNLYAKLFLIEQVLIPFTLLVFLASAYKYMGEIMYLWAPGRIKSFVWICIVFFLFLAIFELKKRWNKKFEMEKSITFGTLCSIIIFNNYSGSGQIISSDTFHPFDNIIGFSQVVELGRKLFSEYIPVSGMYSIFQGAFLHYFGNDYYSYYYVSENIFYSMFSVAIVFFLKRYISTYWCLLVSLLIPVIRYNRVVLIAPIMILLANPRLINKRNLWIKVWILTSLLNGLYYPTYGAAVCIGFLPLGIFQIVSYYKTNLLSDMKKIRFWLEWIISIMPIILCMPLLLGTIRHIKAMADQAVYSDGIARFGQTLPDNFLAYIQHIGVRLLVYDTFTFLIQASLIWVSVALSMKIGCISFENKRIKCKNPEASALCLSFGVALMVAFKFTLIRIDVNSIYARSAGIIYASALMIFLLCERYIHRPVFLYVMVAVSVFYVAVVSGEAIFRLNSSDKLNPYYTVADDYILVDDGYVPRLGTCFVQKEAYDKIVAFYENTTVLDPENVYMGIEGNFISYYLSLIKGDSTLGIYNQKGYSATKETVDLMRRNGSITNRPDPFSQYYFYRWLLLSGEYVWSIEKGLFYPNTDCLTIDEIYLRHKNVSLAPDGRDLGRACTSWGSSMDTLAKIFQSSSAEVCVINEELSSKLQFSESVKGEDADFVYLEFDGMDQDYTDILFNVSAGKVSEIELQEEKKSWFNKNLMKRDYNRGTVVTVFWNDDSGNSHCLNCSMGRGKLLIPLGSSCNWLLNNHENLTITVKKGDEELPVPPITNAELLKIREMK